MHAVRLNITKSGVLVGLRGYEGRHAPLLFACTKSIFFLAKARLSCRCSHSILVCLISCHVVGMSFNGRHVDEIFMATGCTNAHHTCGLNEQTVINWRRNFKANKNKEKRKRL